MTKHPLQRVGKELQTLYDNNPHLVDAYPFIQQSQNYLANNEIINAFNVIKHHQDTLWHIFPEVIAAIDYFEEDYTSLKELANDSECIRIAQQTSKKA